MIENFMCQELQTVERGRLPKRLLPVNWPPWKKNIKLK